MPRVLVIDDDRHVRTIVRLMLEGEGFDVVEATDGEEGLRACRSDPPALILCDVFMPNKDGLEVIQELRGELASVGILAMSGGGFGGTLDLLPTALEFGASDVIYKPFDRVALVAAVRRLLDRSGPSPAGAP